MKARPGGEKVHTSTPAASSGGPIVRYDWSFGDGRRAHSAGAKVAHTYAKPGTYTVKLTETDGCAAGAVFGPLGVSFNGHSAFCKGRRTSQKTLTVRIPKAAVAVVETKRATVAANGLTHLRVACVKELSCTGTVVLRGVAGRPGHQQLVTLGKASFGSIPAGGKAVLTVKSLERRAGDAAIAQDTERAGHGHRQPRRRAETEPHHQRDAYLRGVVALDPGRAERGRVENRDAVPCDTAIGLSSAGRIALQARLAVQVLALEGGGVPVGDLNRAVARARGGGVVVSSSPVAARRDDLRVGPRDRLGEVGLVHPIRIGQPWEPTTI